MNGKRPWIIAFGLTLVALFSVLQMSGATADPGTTEGCRTGVYAEVMTDGTWRLCTTPSVSPSVSPSASPSVSPSPSPSVSPSPSTSPSVSPSPSTSPAPPTGCLADPSACGYPDADNTGAQGTLTVVNGNVRLSTAGMVYADKEVRGCIEVTAPSVTIRNVKITGDCSYSIDYYPYSNTRTDQHMVVENVTIICQSHGNGIGELNFIARRVNISGCENGLDVDRDVLLVDSYIHDLVPETGNSFHTDSIQGIQTRNIVYDHNTLISPRIATSAIIADNLTTNGWTLKNSLLNGGGYTVYCPKTGTITNNRFGDNQWTNSGSNQSYATSCGAGITWSGNVRDATGLAVPKLG